MPNYQGVWSLSEQYQNVAGWPLPPPPLSGDVGLIASGFLSNLSGTTSVEYMNFASETTSADFGDLSTGRSFSAGCSSSTRGVFLGGDPFTGGSNPVNVIDYVTILSKGTASDFGDATVARWAAAGCSSDTRGVFFCGNIGGGSTVNTIDYVTIASTGNAVDFGDFAQLTSGYGSSGCSSTTRGVFLGIFFSGTKNNISYVTIASTGNSTDFGDLSVSTFLAAAASSSTRGLVSGGNIATANVIQYVTIATTGNATDFGDLSNNVYGHVGLSNSTLAVFAGGYDKDAAATTAVMDKVTIATTGNATNFGDLATAKYAAGGCSNSHGGL